MVPRATRGTPGSQHNNTEPRTGFPLSEPATAGSGLLSELQLSLRTKCAYQPLPTSPRVEPASRRLSPNKPGIREAPYSRLSPQAPSQQARRRLWTAVSHHSSLCVRSTPTSTPPNKPLFEPARRRLWTAVRHHNSPSARSAPAIPSQ